MGNEGNSEGNCSNYYLKKVKLFNYIQGHKTKHYFKTTMTENEVKNMAELGKENGLQNNLNWDNDSLVLDVSVI